MDNTKYLSIFCAFEKAPLEEFLKGIFKGITEEQRQSLIIEDVSYHRLNADVVTLEAWMCLAPVESNRWIWVRVEMDAASNTVRELFFTRENYREQALPSLQACMDYYMEKKNNKHRFPKLSLLNDLEDQRLGVTAEEHLRKVKSLRAMMEANGIVINEDIRAFFGPAISEYHIEPAPGTSITRIREIADNIAMSMGVTSVRTSVCQGSIAIEIPNDHRAIVPLRSLLGSEFFRNSTAELPLAIGSTKVKEAKVIDLVDAPHIFVAGASKQGKSVCLHSMVASLLFSKRPDEVKFVFIDPKMFEFREYGVLFNHYLCALPDASSEEARKKTIATRAQDAADVLAGLCTEMEDRYSTLVEAKVNNIRSYNQQAENKLPYIVCFIDEYADLTVALGAKKEAKELAKRITASIIRLAQRGRAAGIHMILSTQRPSVDVITGLIKANFPTRIAFRTSSRIDSMTILDMPGAEKLIGEGDMLLSQGMNLERLQGGYISKEEVSAIIEYISSQKGFDKPYSLPEPKEEAKG